MKKIFSLFLISVLILGTVPNITAQVDSDDDGIEDQYDDCPYDYGTDYYGCPVESEYTVASEQEENGCPLDYPYLWSDGYCYDVSESEQTQSQELTDDEFLADIILNDPDLPPDLRELMIADLPPELTAELDLLLNDLPVHEIKVNDNIGVPICYEYNDCFDPSPIYVNIGDKIIWRNTSFSDSSYTISSGNPVDGPTFLFDSSMMLPGDTFSVVVDPEYWTPGKYTYFDMVHPWAVGEIIVVDNSQTPDELHRQAMELYFAQDYYNSRIVFEQLLELQPKNFGALNDFAVVLDEMGDYDTAIKIYNKIQNIDPSYLPGFYNSGVALLNKGDYNGAITEFEKSLKLQPNDPSILTNLGNAYSKLGETDKARNSIEKAVSLNTGTVNALTSLNLGSSLIQDGNYPEAFKILDQAAQSFPNSFQILEKRGDALYALGEYQKAEIAYRNLADKIPDIPSELQPTDDDHDKLIKKAKLAKEASSGKTADVKQQEEEFNILEWIPVTRLVLEVQRATAPTPAFAQSPDESTRVAPKPGTTIEEATEQKEFEKQVCGEGTVLIGGKCQIVSTGSSDDEGGGCLISTATYGSELAPQVQLLREIRDNTVLSTASGISFMTGFNQLYYSFSPTIADLERENPMFQEAVKVFITPMISTLSIMTLAEDGSEGQVLGLGLSVIALNLAMYVGVPALVGFKVRKIINSRK